MRALDSSPPGFDGRAVAFNPRTPRSGLATAAWIAVALVLSVTLWFGLRKWSETQVTLPDPRLLGTAAAVPLD